MEEKKKRRKRCNKKLHERQRYTSQPKSLRGEVGVANSRVGQMLVVELGWERYHIAAVPGGVSKGHEGWGGAVEKKKANEKRKHSSTNGGRKKKVKGQQTADTTSRGISTRKNTRKTKNKRHTRKNHTIGTIRSTPMKNGNQGKKRRRKPSRGSCTSA